MHALTFHDGQTLRAIPGPKCTELMLGMLALQPTDKVMEIGTGSGTQTAVWAKHCGELHTIELKPFLDPGRLGDIVYFRYGDGAEGIPQEAPFDAIVATCGVRELPAAWGEQLRDGGRMVAPVGLPDCQKLTLFRKAGRLLNAERIAAYCRFQMME